MIMPSDLAIFWVVAVTVSFNIPYLLFLWDRGRKGGFVHGPRIAATMIIGTLIVIGTYAATLTNKQFDTSDCMLLALVAAHGWTAEGMVQSFIKSAAQQQPAPSDVSAAPAHAEATEQPFNSGDTAF